MDRARQTGSRRHSRRHYAAGLSLAAALGTGIQACRNLTISETRVIAIEVTNAKPTVVVGDTIRLSARALNGLGDVVSSAVVTWLPVDTATGFTLDPAGLVTAFAPGSWRVAALAVAKDDSLRSDPIPVTVTAAPAPVAVGGAPTRFELLFPTNRAM